MPGSTRAMPRRRLVAAIVAVSLSGLPGVAARAMATAPIPCACPSHGARHSDHPCECASRHGAAPSAQRAPPCHPSARTPPGDPAPASTACARMAGHGTLAPTATPPPSTDAFALPDVVQLTQAGSGERLDVAAASPHHLAVSPDPPPPRPA